MRLTLPAQGPQYGPDGLDVADPRCSRPSCGRRSGAPAWCRARSWSTRLDARRRGPPPDARQRRRRVGQDHRWSATGSPGAAGAGRVGRPRRRRQRPGAVLALRRRGAAARRARRLDDQAVGRARGPRTTPSRPACRRCSTRPRSCRSRPCSRSTTTTSSPTRRSTSRWRSWSSHLPERLRLVMASRTEPPIGARAGCGRAASWPRSARPTCASTTARPPPCSAASWGSTSSDAEVAALRLRTEGWAAGLYLAGAVAARPGRRAGVHRRLRRRRPAGGGLPRRGGARGPAPGARGGSCCAPRSSGG